MIAVEDQLAFKPAWQVQIVEKRVARIVGALARVAVDVAIEVVVCVSIASVAPSWIEAIERRLPPERGRGRPLSKNEYQTALIAPQPPFVR
jgi:hypothetical protein